MDNIKNFMGQMVVILKQGFVVSFEKWKEMLGYEYFEEWLTDYS